MCVFRLVSLLEIAQDGRREGIKWISHVGRKSVDIHSSQKWESFFFLFCYLFTRIFGRPRTCDVTGREEEDGIKKFVFNVTFFIFLVNRSIAHQWVAHPRKRLIRMCVNFIMTSRHSWLISIRIVRPRATTDVSRSCCRSGKRQTCLQNSKWITTTELHESWVMTDIRRGIWKMQFYCC